MSTKPKTTGGQLSTGDLLFLKQTGFVGVNSKAVRARDAKHQGAQQENEVFTAPTPSPK